jgi:hypothetical protein
VFQNQLISLGDTTEAVILHALQMNYDYINGQPWSATRAREGTASGLGVLFNSTAGDEAKWLRFNNPGGVGSVVAPTTVNGQPIPAQMYTDFKKTLCMKDPSAPDTDLKRKYYVASQYETSSLVYFYNNYRCSSGIDAMVSQNEWLYSLHGGSAVYAGLYLDQVNSQPLDAIPACNNPCLTGGEEVVYPDQASGQLEYIRRIRDHFKNTLGGQGVSGNPFRVKHYLTQHQSVPLDLYYNENGSLLTNEAADFSPISPNQVVVPLPANDLFNNDYLQALRTAGIAMQQGSWFGWFARANPSQTVNGVQLLRALPNWDNLVNATARAWDPNALKYQTSNSYADLNVVYGRHPKTRKLFVVFQSKQGMVQLRPGETVTGVQRVDNLFIETTDGFTDLTIANSRVMLKKGSSIGKGYVVTVN